MGNQGPIADQRLREHEIGWASWPEYAAVMTDICNKVTEVGLPNYHGARLQLPSNMNFPEWEALAHTAEDKTLINFLKYGFPVGYEGSVPLMF